MHILPEPDTILEFKNWKYGTWAPFVIYADLEAILEPLNQHRGKTTYSHKHTACAASALLVSTVDKFKSIFEIYTGQNSVEQLLEKLIQWETLIIEHLKINRNMRRLTPEKLQEHRNATVCHICRNAALPFDPNDPNLRKVADHDHVSGYYFGAAHDVCNRNRRVVYDIPVIIHNFRGYDSHLIVTALKNYPDREMKVIGQNMERYLQLKWGKHIVFRDSFMFLSSSLDSLVQSLRKTNESKFNQLTHRVNTLHPGVDSKLLLRKGVFPYEYLESFDKFNDQQLPPREAFFSSLRGEECKQEDYDYAQQVWRTFSCQTLLDYLKLYLTSDVCQLADVFQNFRDICFNMYKLDPAYFISAPQLSWNSAFKKLHLKLELISDSEMYRMVHPSVRGGICHASGRYARANNKYMGALYRPNEPESFIMYIDATNLYGWAMSQELPFSQFAWLSEAEMREAEAALTSPDFEQTEKYLDSLTRYLNETRRVAYADGIPDPPARTDLQPATKYFFEVDLEYPDDLHERDDDYPLAPELMEIKEQMLSDKQRQLCEIYYGRSPPYSKKLVCSLLPKKNYVVFSETLKFYIKRGMRVTKLHRAIRFETKAMLEPYIALNTSERDKAGKDECRRAFFKIMNNALFGKTIESVEKRVDIRLLSDMDKARRLAEKPHCMDFRIFNEDLVAVQMRKVNQLINKPFQIGFAILEYSKLHMYRTYAKLKDHFKAEMRMLYTDTDSLILQFFRHDLYKDLLEVPELRVLFDFSPIPANCPSGLGSPYDPNKGKVGFFKSETHGNPIVEFVGLKPKMYSFQVCDCCEVGSTAMPHISSKQVGKGIARDALKKLTHEIYLQKLHDAPATTVTNRRLGSKLHQLYTIAVEKRGLIAYDDKRVLLADLPNGQPNPQTHAYGHHLLADAVRVEHEEGAAVGDDLHIEQRLTRNQRYEQRLVKKHKRVLTQAKKARRDGDESDDSFVEDEEDFVAMRAAAERRPGGMVHVDDVITRLCHQNGMDVPTSPPPRIPLLDQRAGALIQP